MTKKLKLIQKDAIEQAILIWEQRAETRECDNRICPLCTYTRQRSEICFTCPYYKRYGKCDIRDSAYVAWRQVETPAERKFLAVALVGLLKSLRKVKGGIMDLRQAVEILAECDLEEDDCGDCLLHSKIILEVGYLGHLETSPCIMLQEVSDTLRVLGNQVPRT